jgi:uncharacterized protein
MSMEKQAGPSSENRLAPVEASDRIAALDGMRGLAVLGILAVNASAFALPVVVQTDPNLAPFAVAGDNAAARWVVEVFFQQKFITLFAMLFGASIFLVGGEGGDPARGRLLRRRLFWLGAIALIHGLVFWYGDVLLVYAVSGLFVMLMRGLSAKLLIGIGLGATLAMGAMQAGLMWLITAGPPAVVEIFKTQDNGSAETVRATIAAYRDGWAGPFVQNLFAWLIQQGGSLTMYVPATVALMMTGMGLFKAGFLSGRAPVWLYAAVIAVGAAVLALLARLEWIEIMAAPDSHPTRGMAEVVASFPIFVTLAYVGLIVLATTRGLSILTAPLRPVGRMAFTNYLTQTLIMATIFYLPWGPRLFGQVDFTKLWVFVLAVWAVQLVWSPLWLAAFRMGPLEWVWRRLTYGRPVPIRKAA